MTTIHSKALYLGNTNNKDCGFTVYKEYDIYDFEDGYIGAYDDNDSYLYFKNGAFHKFKLHDGDIYFITETQCAVMPPSDDKKTELRYYINGHEVEMIEFENVRYTVDQLGKDGVKCDTIKFEVKFE